MYYGHDFGERSVVGGQFVLETRSRFGLDLEIAHRDFGVGSPELWFGDANATLRFAQCSWLNGKVGAGLAWGVDSGANGGADFGGNVLYSLDAFPFRPLIATAVAEAGMIGNERWFTHAQATGGWSFGLIELFVGVDHFELDARQQTTMLAGLRFWQ